MNKKIELDYLTPQDLNEIEQKIYEYTEEVKPMVGIPTYTPKVWTLNELPYIQEIDRIETGIYNLGYYYNRPKGWLPTKVWIPPENLYPIKSFDYKDYNRWVNNLTIFKPDIVVDDTIWNGNSTYIWEETMPSENSVLYDNSLIKYEGIEVQYEEE